MPLADFSQQKPKAIQRWLDEIAEHRFGNRNTACGH
jgi:hypothetical protein